MESLLAREAGEAAARARDQLATAGPLIAACARRLAARPPAVIATCARGSSDHAATYGAYLLETTLGRVVASVGPSVAPHLAFGPDMLVLAISQSGRSPDLVRFAAAARAGGAFVVGLVNDVASPLAAACELAIPLCAGEERAVAATKSCLLAHLALLQLAAAWSGDAALHDAVAQAPDALAAAAALAWDLTPLAAAAGLYVVARGLGLAAALEIALKLKETCQLHAEGFSAAEVLHGPAALVAPGFPILALGDDPALTTLAALGATIHAMPAVAGVSPLLAPLCALQSCYLALPALAAARGLDADAPRHLKKITETR